MIYKPPVKQYFILIAADVHKLLKTSPSAYEVVLYRLGRMQWGLNERTRNRKAIKPGDELIIYASGSRVNGMCFVAQTTAASHALPTTIKQRDVLSDPKNSKKIISEYFISLKDTIIYRSPVSIRLLLGNLDFIKNPNSPKWGIPLIGGALKISQKDFFTISNIGKKSN
jgi:predicted RNA-binding protein with PUA-like domain